MKKILTKEEKERIKKRNMLILGIVLVFLLIIAPFGYSFFSNDNIDSGPRIEKRSSRGLDFQRVENFWISEINFYEHAFFYLPEELDDVEVNLSLNINELASQPLYLVSSGGAKNIVAYNLVNPEYVLRVNDACVEGIECEDVDLPVKDCENDNIIIFLESDKKTRIYQENKCVYVEGDIIKGADRLMYYLLIG